MWYLFDLFFSNHLQRSSLRCFEDTFDFLSIKEQLVVESLGTAFVGSTQTTRPIVVFASSEKKNLESIMF